MRQLLRRLAHKTGLLHAPSDPARSATRPLRVLLVSSITFPVVLYAVAATISYHQHFDDARDRLRRNLAIVHEHAQKVFETFEFASRYLDEITAGVSNEQIRASEHSYSDRLRAMTMSLPQLRDLWIIGPDGYPLVSGTVFPMPRIDLSDRNYFKAQHDSVVDEPYVSQVIEARAANTQFFAITRKRTLDGKFNGVALVSIAPEYFSEFYSQLPPPGAAALLRADGAVLARYPDIPGIPRRLRSDAPFMSAIRANPTAGFITAPSSLDGRVRIFTYRQLAKLPNLYVSVSVERAAVIRDWMVDMASHLIFGIPAMLALVGLGLIALRRSERLQQEVIRRESTELALRQAQKMEAVGRLSGGIAHDFNNMLTVILGNIDMASRRLDDNPRVQRLLDSARKASERAAILVERLLAFSRQHPQEVKAVDINRLVQSMSELLRRTIGETVAVETVLAGGLWKVAVDANQLENAILNLAVNARDAMPDGGGLTVETSNSYLDEAYVALNREDEIAPGQYVMLAVTDSGGGMSREVRERAFEPFFTTKAAGMGTGLGLSMVYGFIKQSSGHIKIYSEPGEGTTIKLYFPRIAEQRGLPEWTEERASSRPAPGDRGAETILLVEDDEEVRNFSSEVLREQGYTVLAVADGPSALRLLETEPAIGLLFTDVVLPGRMNGRQLADEAHKRKPALKVLYATGYTRNAIIHQGRLDAEVELLTKPFTAEALARKVRQILNAKPSAAEPNASA